MLIFIEAPYRLRENFISFLQISQVSFSLAENERKQMPGRWFTRRAGNVITHIYNEEAPVVSLCCYCGIALRIDCATWTVYIRNDASYCARNNYVTARSVTRFTFQASILATFFSDFSHVAVSVKTARSLSILKN